MNTAIIHYHDDDSTVVVSFDGVVLEVFSANSDEQVRLHIAQLQSIDVKSEDGKSELVVDPDADVFPLEVEDEAVVGVMELVDTVQKAIAAYRS